MYRSLLSAAALAASLWASAQGQYLHQVFALSEGYYDYFNGGGQLIPVTLGVFDPQAGTYATVATLNGPRFGSDVLVHAGSVYVAADDRVLRFDADTYAQQAMAEVVGVRKLAVWNDLLLLTRGELGGLPHYFEARDRLTLDLLWTIDPADGLAMSAEGIVVKEGRAYLAVGNAFDWSNLVGKVGVVDLAAQAYSEVDLGPDGINPERLFLRGDEVVAFCNTDFSRSTVSKLSLGGGLPAVDYTVTVAANSGCASSALVESLGRVYFHEFALGQLARFDVDGAVVSDTLAGSPGVYGLVEDPVNGVLYASTTDFFSGGDLHVLGLDGQVLSTVPAAVSIGNLALDVRLSTAVRESQLALPAAWPNPADHELFVRLPQPVGAVEVIDAMGRVALRQAIAAGALARIGLEGLAPGPYTVRAEGLGAVRFVKR